MRVIPAEDVDLRQLYEAVAPELWRALFAHTRDREIASDATSEAFSQYLGRRGEVRSPRGWLWTAAFRIAAGELARRGRDLRPAPVETVEDQEIEPILDILATLPERQRAVTLLRYYAGYEPIEIARILGMSPSTVRVHLLRARRRLATLLEDDDED